MFTPGSVPRCLGKFARWFPQVVPGAALEIAIARHRKKEGPPPHLLTPCSRSELGPGGWRAGTPPQLRTVRSAARPRRCPASLLPKSGDLLCQNRRAPAVRAHPPSAPPRRAERGQHRTRAHGLTFTVTPRRIYSGPEVPALQADRPGISPAIRPDHHRHACQSRGRAHPDHPFGAARMARPTGRRSRQIGGSARGYQPGFA